MKKNLDYSGWLFASGMKKLFLIMKLTTLFIFLIVFHVSASSYSQATKFKLKLNEKTIKDVLIEIEEQSQFHFLYNDEFTDLNRIVTVNTENADVEDVLDQVFANSSITYRVLENNLIVLTPSGSNVQVAQSKTVKGIVKDKQGSPLPGVTVVEKGTTNGTITDFDGNYSIEVPTSATLVFSFVGMQVKEIAVAGQSSINVVLEEETLGIDEVVVVGYGTQKKGSITGAIAQFDAEQLDERPVQRIDQALVGQMPGVRVKQTSGMPAKASVFRFVVPVQLRPTTNRFT